VEWIIPQKKSVNYLGGWWNLVDLLSGVVVVRVLGIVRAGGEEEESDIVGAVWRSSWAAEEEGTSWVPEEEMEQTDQKNKSIQVTKKQKYQK